MLQLSEAARKLGFRSVEQVRREICSRYAEYDTCSVCPYWEYRKHCTLLEDADDYIEEVPSDE